ncbi:MAG: MIP/aquaporin family protein [Acidimicrobiia bacterium]
MSITLTRRLVAEFVGTALLVLFGPGSVVAALRVGNGSLDYGGLGFIALAFGLVVAVVIYGFGAISGAHINPAVTFTLALTRRFPWVEFVPYVVAQLLGAAVGGLLVVAIFSTAAVDLGGVGSTVLSPDVSYASGVAAEALGTFILVFAIMAVAVDPRAPKGWAGLMIGLAVTLAILVTGPLTGASLNPARTFGPYLASALFDGAPPWEDFSLYWLGPFIGGAAAAIVYDLVAQPRHVVVDVGAAESSPSGEEVDVAEDVGAAETSPAGQSGGR